MSAKNLQKAKKLRNDRRRTGFFSAEMPLPKPNPAPLAKTLKFLFMAGLKLEKVIKCTQEANFFGEIPSKHTVTNQAT